MMLLNTESTNQYLFILMLSFLLISIVLVGCGEIEEDNNQPVIKSITSQEIDAKDIFEVGETIVVELNLIDADSGDTHTIRATTDDSKVATVSVRETILVIKTVGRGVAVISVFVTDDSGQDNASAKPFRFTIRVRANSQPMLEAIPDQVLDVGETVEIELHLTDSDSEDTHTINATSNNTRVATVSVRDTTLIIETILEGTSTITVTATDNSGKNNAEAEPVTFTVAVLNRCQIPPFDEDYEGNSIYFISDRLGEGCVMLSDGIYVAFACNIGNRIAAFGGPVQTATQARVKFGGFDFINRNLERIPDGELTEFEVSDAVDGDIELIDNRRSVTVEVLPQNVNTIAGGGQLIGFFVELRSVCIPNIEQQFPDLIIELTEYAQDLLKIMHDNP